MHGVCFIFALVRVFYVLPVLADVTCLCINWSKTSTCGKRRLVRNRRLPQD